MSDTCKTCRWFLPASETAPNNFCRRFPPAPVHTSIGEDGKIKVHFTFAVISGANACGEHQPQPKEETL